MASVDKCCRICRQTKVDTFSIYEHLNSEYLPTVIYNISGVKILPRQEPTAKICSRCAKSVINAHAIILRCQQSDELLEYKKSRKVSNEKEQKANKLLVCHNTQDDEDTVEYLNNFSQEDSGEDTQYIEISNIKNEEIIKDSGNNQTIIKSTTTDKAKTENIKRKRSSDSTKTTNFFCDKCDFQTKIGKLLVSHKSDIHQIYDPNIYDCTLCPARFSWKPTLYRHIQLVHKTLPEDKKFICKECGKAYTREVHLTEHTKQRHGPRRFKCADPNCEQTFTRAFTLRRHFLAVHANKTRYHCTDCDKYFKIYDLWKYHNEVVHKNATVYCPRCGYPFRYKEKLEEHLEKEVCKRSIVPCPYCQRRFTAKSGLREHLKNIHQMA